MWNQIEKKEIIAYIKQFGLNSTHVEDIIKNDFKILNVLNEYINNGLPTKSDDLKEWEKFSKDDLIEILETSGIQDKHVQRWIENEYYWFDTLLKFYDNFYYRDLRYTWFHEFYVGHDCIYETYYDLKYIYHLNCGAPEHEFNTFVKDINGFR